MNWDYNNCREESKKYTSRGEFWKGSNRAYRISSKNKWLDDFTWLVSKTHLPGYWTYERCKEESRKYESITEFCEGSNTAYKKSLTNKWLEDFTWLKRKVKPSGYWTYERCYEAALGFTSKKRFSESYKSAYSISLKKGWIDSYDWFKNPNFKWDTYEACEKLAKTCTTYAEFRKASDQAYKHSKANGWLERFTWMKGRFRWTKELVDEEAKKYSSQGEFSDKCWCAFNLARKSGWLKEYTWFKPKHRSLDYELCKKEASKYSSKKEFKENDSWCHEVSRKNGWLDEFFRKD